MTFQLDGKIAVISGGSRGIGLATGRLLVGHGASVAFAGRHDDTVERAVADLQQAAAAQGHDSRVLGIAVDLTAPGGVETVVERTLATFGGADILVNGVGDSSYGPFTEITDEMVVSSWTIKVLTALRLTRAIVPIMERRGGGAIVNISGGAGRDPQPGGVPAAIANAGLRVFSKGGASDLARRGIAMNTISLGVVATDRHLARARAAATRTGKSVEEVLQEWDRETPTGRVTAPEEVAELIVFLASRRVLNLVGAEIVLDGGSGHGL
ncbi:MAG TPA: SDR family oxidoreductase [Chloroflexota bacterium]|nr:SDR family oxidoreductase [Chloroflexota bacterium]